MITSRPRSAAAAGVLEHLVGRAVRRDDADLVGDAELDEHVDRALHHRQVGVAAHDHPDARVAHAGDRLMDTCRMRTRLTEMLGIEHPVMLAGMGGVSYQRVVAAVSDAGGFGTLGAATMSSEQLDDEMRGVRKLTDKPFGVDLLAALPERMVDDADKVVDGGASLFVAGLGVPRDVIKVLHDGNVLVASMCGKVRHAIAAVEAGCDFVIAQGTEAGGHTGTVATMPLVPQIVDAVGERVPVVAAGGIFDGRGLAAAIALGADGVWLGTRFIATPEARTVARLQGRAAARARGRHRDQPRLHRQDAARDPQRVDAVRRGAPRGAEQVPRADGQGRTSQRAAPRRRREHRRRPEPRVLPVGSGRRRDRRARCPPATSCADRRRGRTRPRRVRPRTVVR